MEREKQRQVLDEERDWELAGAEGDRDQAKNWEGVRKLQGF